MKKILNIMLVLVFTFTFLFACSSQTSTKTAETTTKAQTTPVQTILETEKPTEIIKESESNVNNIKIEISIKDYGKIQLELERDKAPITVDNFVKLVNEKFYDGLTFHRIISGFMIQGGDPLGNGTGGSDETIKGEFSSNGVNNPISHKRGVISMARSMNKDSASSQFFIMHQDGEFLDGDYAAFGHVISGIEVVDAICDAVEPLDNNGTIARQDQPVIEYIKVIE